mgnify:CR=1 FL=1
MNIKNSTIYAAIVILLIIITFLAVFNLRIQSRRDFTELYFVNKLPKDVKVNENYNFSFVVHNLENKHTVYNYTVNLGPNLINQGFVNLDHNQIAIINQTFKVTQMNNGLIPVSVKLLNKDQDIHFWVNAK